MPIVKDYFKVGGKAGDIGIEIEICGKHLPALNSLPGFWRKDKDDSLRGPETAEFILKSPVKEDEVNYVISSLWNQFKNYNTEFTDPITAGTHVHINVQDLSIKQVITLICCYFIIEELLVDWCSPSRKGNHHCLRGVDAEWLVEKIVDAVEASNLYELNTNDIRYSGINLLALFQYGSIEFRSFEGNPDPERLETWCKMLHTMKNNSKMFSSPTDIFDCIRGDGHEVFLSTLMGKYTNKIKDIHFISKMKKGMRLAADIAYCCDWGIVKKNIFKKENTLFS